MPDWLALKRIPCCSVRRENDCQRRRTRRKGGSARGHISEKFAETCYESGRYGVIAVSMA
jgi:hypothetical protein